MTLRKSVPYRNSLTYLLTYMCMRRNGQNSTCSQICIPRFDISMAVSYSTRNLGGDSAKIYACFERKMAVVMLNLVFWGLIGDGYKLFCRNFKPQKDILC